MTTDAPTLYPCVRYRDARAAIDWLERAFEFERMMVYPDDSSRVVHAELSLRNGVLMVSTLAAAAIPPRRYNAPYVHVAD